MAEVLNVTGAGGVVAVGGDVDSNAGERMSYGFRASLVRAVVPVELRGRSWHSRHRESTFRVRALLRRPVSLSAPGGDHALLGRDEWMCGARDVLECAHVLRMGHLHPVRRVSATLSDQS